MKRYYPRRPVKSFQDLEVYQKTLGLAVEINRKIKSRSKISQNLREIVLKIPKQIATAHSKRFAEPNQALALLEKTMLNCNLTAYYLELDRDLVNPNRKKKIEADFFEEQIKEYLRVRGKILRLQRAWKKFMEKSRVNQINWGNQGS